MATEVKLNNMTINLVPDKETYDGMTKNPNEIYLVQEDYDMVVEINEIPGASGATGNVVVGNCADVVSKMEANPDYIPNILLKVSLYYGPFLTKTRCVVHPFIFYGNQGAGLMITINWIFTNGHAFVSVTHDNGVSVSTSFLQTY